ncbi:MAG: GtrA family protein [Aigarchaeota archaeon]|nr:GtrA family protein [Aigarchaeota archaeon]MCX8192658.1 GtrA family protein [Nitrososphaeria archaeon]MDW7985618.1 GtrA family protein [Nitrososphaerota archaeon]
MKYLNKLFTKIVKKIFSPEFLKFNIVGGIGVVVNMVSYIVLNDWLAIHYMLAGALSTEISIINNFLLNDLWTFRSRSRKNSMLIRAGLFHASRIFGMVVTLATLYLLVDIFNMNDLVAYLIAIGLGVLVNFYTSDVYVWSGK